MGFPPGNMLMGSQPKLDTGILQIDKTFKDIVRENDTILSLNKASGGPNIATLFFHTGWNTISAVFNLQKWQGSTSCCHCLKWIWNHMGTETKRDSKVRLWQILKFTE